MSPRRPSLALPRGACDTHCHVFGPAKHFPFAPDPPFTPADAPKERLFALHEMLGIERGVIVQSTCHGFDNKVVADAIAARGGAYCGIALAPLSITDITLLRLHHQGFRGLRFNLNNLQTSTSEIIDLTSRLVPLGWHLQVHLDCALLDQIGPWLLRSAIPIVIDHLGRVDASSGLQQRGFHLLCQLLQDQRMWVKLSGCDRVSTFGPPYADVVPFARTLFEQFGDRTLWGTDWPHPMLDHVPDDGLLVDLLSEIAPSESSLKALLVDNPQRLYRFPVGLQV